MTRENVVPLSELDSLSKEIECIMCLNIANDPRMCVHCSAIVCVECIQNWINIRKSCPKCSNSVELTDFVRCRLANRMIDFIEGSKSNNLCDHSNELPRVYCTTCKLNVCVDCILLNDAHINHDYKYTDEDYEEILLVNYKLIDFIRKKCKNYQDKIDSIESDIQTLLNNHNEALKWVNSDQKRVEHWVGDTQRLFEEYQQKKLPYSDALQIEELFLNDIEQRVKNSKTLSDQEEILQILQKHIHSKTELNNGTL